MIPPPATGNGANRPGVRGPPVASNTGRHKCGATFRSGCLDSRSQDLETWRNARTLPKEDAVMKMLKMCLNWKIVTALAAVGAGIYLVTPHLVAAALPSAQHPGRGNLFRAFLGRLHEAREVHRPPSERGSKPSMRMVGLPRTSTPYG